MKKKFILGIGFVATFSFLFAITSSLAWFDNKQTIKTEEVIAQTKGAYYASGSGTKDDPYIINQPVHLYNLAWLQYMGLYNEDDDNDGSINQYYFKVEGNKTENGNSILDMSGWTLPPIGTQDNPFVGDFDGNNVIIKNLTISNDEDDFIGNSAKPEKVTTFTKPSIIGFFGVIGAVDDKTYAYSSTSNLAYDTYVDNITIKNGDGQKTVLAGLFAGFVNAEIKNCGVGYGKFDFAEGTTNIATTPAQTDEEGTTANSNVSNYTLVGAYNPKNFSWTAPSGKGNENDWGGSIDIASLSKRVTYITNNSTLSEGSETSYPTYVSSDFGTSFYQSPDKYKWDYSEKNSGQYCALEAGTYLPLNVDTTKINETDYSTDKKESILSTNTGYLVGYGQKGNAGPRVTNKLTNASAKGIKYSLANQANSNDSSTRAAVFTQSNIALFYYDTINKTTNRILDEYNSSTIFNSSPSNTSTINLSSLNLQKYSAVKKQFIDMLDSGTSKTNMDNKKVVLNGIQIFKLKSSDLTTTDATNVTLNGKTYANYQFYSGGFNFTLKSTGIATMIVGCYTTANYHQLPQIFKLERDSNNKITSRTEIKTIYQDGTGIYYNDTSKGTTINLGAMTSNQVLLQNCAYYIEVPLTAGDYYFASIDQSNNCPYILYLDIGANAGDDSGGSTDTSLPKVDFVYYNDSKTLVKITDTGYIKSQIVFKIPSSVSGLFEFNRTSSTTVFYYIASGNTITPVADSKEVSATKSDTELTEN